GGGRRGSCPALAGGFRCRLPLSCLQGCECLPLGPRRAVGHAAGPVRPRRGRAGVMRGRIGPAADRALGVARRVLSGRYGVVIAITALVLVLPLLVTSTFHLRIAVLVFIFALTVLGLNLLMGFAGQVSLGHAGFFGSDAYAV